MQRSSLHNPYPVIEKDGVLSFGGNQAWSDSAVMRKCGCGVIGGTDLLLYLSLHKDICRTELFQEAYLENGILELPEYMSYVNYFRKKYLPVIPHFGMAGWMLVLGLNRYFRHERIRPVSYTHLDVYKRQACGKSGGRKRRRYCHIYGKSHGGFHEDPLYHN